ncbi:S1 family peptidase [Streptomyces sp. NPDC014894]|uniref:S1 family peptidase n=1 Tax=unclassified Streptomyces TaxID=2593676 RepID=UPI00370306B8
MKHRRNSGGKALLAGGAVLALAVGGLTVQSAVATDNDAPPATKKLSASAAGDLATALGGRLGDSAAGAHYDAGARTLVVNVVDRKAADTVREEGARARIVANTADELDGARKTLADRAAIPGTSWAVDPVANKVVVTADRTVTDAELARLDTVVRSLGDRAELKKSAGAFTPYLVGGDAIHSGGGRCSLGFNVVKGGQPHFITAGHCGATGSQWSATAGGAPVGQMTVSSFPGNDYALVKYGSAGAQPSEVDLHDGSAQRITRAADATVGMPVQRSGSTTQLHEGTVTGLDATVNYGNGDIVNGLIQTDVCAEPGDSGGSLFSGESAVGLTSGGSGNCSSGGTTFFQPVPEVLRAVGAQIG